MIKANDPKLSSWIEIKSGCDFPLQNLPFGIFKTNDSAPRAASAIGDYVIDLHALHTLHFFDSIDLPHDVFEHPSLNAFISRGKECTRAVRNRLSELFDAENGELRDRTEYHSRMLTPMEEAQLLMPVKVGDYTDFYSSEQHAFNVGSMFRDPEHALLPNWKHLPVGYHGRASSIVVSGTPIHRPKGQMKEPDQKTPVFGPTKRLDFELEMAFITGQCSAMGSSIPVEEADDYIFGFVIFNDWSARDLQTWEYVPLGPFLAKNFASSISPWVVTLDALEPFRVAGPRQDPKVLPYLEVGGKRNFDLNLEVYIQPEGAGETRVSSSNFRYMYWNVNQQLAHHTVNGCNINVGDMYASGTISGPTPDAYGSMLELAWKGTKPIPMEDGTERKFILDGDTVIMRAHAERNGIRIGFGEVRTKILPAKQDSYDHH